MRGNSVLLHGILGCKSILLRAQSNVIPSSSLLQEDGDLGILNFLEINDVLKCYLRAPIGFCSREYETVIAM